MTFDEDLRRDEATEPVAEAVEETAEQTAEAVEETAEQAAEAVEETVEEAAETVEETAEEAAEAVEETAEEAAEAVEETAEEAAEAVEETAETAEEAAAEFAAPPKKKKGIVGWIVLAVVLLCAAAAAVMYFTWQSSLPPAEQIAQEQVAVTVKGGESLSVESDAVTPELASTVVATLKKRPERSVRGWLTTLLENKTPSEPAELTNAELAVFYWNSFYQFSNQYYYYAEALGIDPAHLDSGEADEGQTWQEFFLSAALSAFRTQNAVYLSELDAGMELPEDYQADFDSMTEELTSMEDIGEKLRLVYGPGVTLDDYLSFMRSNYYYNAFIERYGESLEFSEDDLRAYYNEHADEFGELEISDTAAVTVRHVLIEPTDPEDDESWAAAEEQANQLYAQWKTDGATEDGFAELAERESADYGSAANGGLYESVVPGKTAAEFNDWCFDPARQAGDHGVIRTEFGYHIMYFVSADDAPYWVTQVEPVYKLEKSHEAAENIARGYEMTYDLSQAHIALAGQIEEAETADQHAG